MSSPLGNDDTEVLEFISASAAPLEWATRALRAGDLAACLAAERFTQRSCVTVAVDECKLFHWQPEPATAVVGSGAEKVASQPATTGQQMTLVLKARVNRTWSTSCEVGVKMLLESASGALHHYMSAYFTFVSLDSNGKRTTLPSLAAPDNQGTEAWRRFVEANERRRIRLA